MKEGVFILLQIVSWCFIFAAWVHVARQQPRLAKGRQALSQCSLVCATVTLLFTTAMTIYVRACQQRPYDTWEARYLLATTVLSVLGIAFAAIGKTSPRLLGHTISTFTLLVALADAASL